MCFFLIKKCIAIILIIKIVYDTYKSLFVLNFALHSMHLYLRPGLGRARSFLSALTLALNFEIRERERAQVF